MMTCANKAGKCGGSDTNAGEHLITQNSHDRAEISPLKHFYANSITICTLFGPGSPVFRV